MPTGHELSPGELAEEVNRQFSFPALEATSYTALLQALATEVRQLINKDFNRLIFLLYRIDVSEQKLKSLLVSHPEEDAATVIAKLIVERLEQKLKTRQQFNGGDNKDASEEERW